MADDIKTRRGLDQMPGEVGELANIALDCTIEMEQTFGDIEDIMVAAIGDDVSDDFLDFASKRHWKELTVNEFKGLVESVRSMEHVGREQQKITLHGKKMDLADQVTRVQENLADVPHSAPVCVFQSIPDTDFRRSRTAFQSKPDSVSVDPGHRFSGKPDTEGVGG